MSLVSKFLASGPVRERFPTPLGETEVGKSPTSVAWLLLLSLLVLLNTPIFIALTTGMDQYGFFTMDAVARRPYPAVLSLAVNVSLAVLAYALYRFIWRWESAFIERGWEPIKRTAVAVGIPVFLAMVPSFLMCSTGGKPYYVVIGVLMTGSLCITSAIRYPNLKVDPHLARFWFGAATGCILVLLTLAITGMLFFYFIDQIPASSNFTWQLDFRWSDLGYGPEGFPQRQRDGLLVFGITGIGYMALVLGGAMLVSIFNIARLLEITEGRVADSEGWGEEILERMSSELPSNGEDTPYAAFFQGHEGSISTDQYEWLVSPKRGGPLSSADLLIDRMSGSVSVRTAEGRVRMDFRVGILPGGRRSGPFSLLCIYARYPGRRFANGELRTMLSRELDRTPDSVNVGDFIGQLQRRTPRLPVERDDAGSYIPGDVRVCLLEPRNCPGDFASPAGGILA